MPLPLRCVCVCSGQMMMVAMMKAVAANDVSIPNSGRRREEQTDLLSMVSGAEYDSSLGFHLWCI